MENLISFFSFVWTPSPRHNIYELVWFLKTGGTRMARMMLGLEPFVADINILLEGYQHYTRSVICRRFLPFNCMVIALYSHLLFCSFYPTSPHPLTCADAELQLISSGRQEPPSSATERSAGRSWLTIKICGNVLLEEGFYHFSWTGPIWGNLNTLRKLTLWFVWLVYRACLSLLCNLSSCLVVSSLLNTNVKETCFVNVSIFQCRTLEEKSCQTWDAQTETEVTSSQYWGQ